MAISADEKDRLFRNPPPGQLHLGRRIATAAHGKCLWSAVQMGKGKETWIHLSRTDESGRESVFDTSPGGAHQPALAVSQNGNVVVIWNEASPTGWEIRCASVEAAGNGFGPVEVLHNTEALCLPPTVVFAGGGLIAAWAQREGKRLRVHVSRKLNGKWTPPNVVSPADADCFRPTMASDGDRVVLAWDTYLDGRYQIQVAELDGENWCVRATLGAEGERWLSPRCVCDPAGVYVTWVVLQPVTDKLGIIDHQPFGMVGRLTDKDIRILGDEGNSNDQRIVADLRDGLLASRIYKGYVGLRRNPQPSIDGQGRLWCFWELRGEGEGSSVRGMLVARSLQPDGQWGPSRVISLAGYAYSVPSCFQGPVLPISYLDFEARDADVLRSAWIDSQTDENIETEESHWQRWTVVPIVPEARPAQTAQHDGRDLKLFWADTHVHSVFSPDAEGELDELANFARDQAGLNVLTVIDNDYYPHKALTEAEWRIHQDLAEHFAEKGRFVWMPGYEYTYHRSDLSPDFNHRCVIYSRRGPLYRRIDPEADSDRKMIAALKAADAMAYPHHCTYQILDSAVERNVEVVSSWRTCLEETDFTIRQLQAGQLLGFIGSSDTHRTVPGLAGARTGIFAAELTPEALFEAYRQRRLIATQGHNVFIDFRIDDAFIGGQVRCSSGPRVTASVVAPESLERVDLIRNGEVILSEAATGTSFSLDHVDTGLPVGRHFYFLRVKMVGDPSFNRDPGQPSDARPFYQDGAYPHNLARARGPLAWTSPIWVDRA